MVATVEQDIALFEAFQEQRLHTRVVVVRATLFPLFADPPCGAQERNYTLDHALEELNLRASEQKDLSIGLAVGLKGNQMLPFVASILSHAT